MSQPEIPWWRKDVEAPTPDRPWWCAECRHEAIRPADREFGVCTGCSERMRRRPMPKKDAA